MTSNRGDNSTDARGRAENDRADEPKTCENCGVRIDTSQWHPVVAEEVDGTFRVYAFCDASCRDEWID